MGDVRVEATQWHTCHGYEYAEGAQYDTDEQTAASLVAQGKAKRVDATASIAPAKPDADNPHKVKAATVQAAAPVTRTTAVEPMTTDAAPIVTPKARNRTTAAPRAPKAKGKAKGKGKR